MLEGQAGPVDENLDGSFASLQFLRDRRHPQVPPVPQLDRLASTRPQLAHAVRQMAERVVGLIVVRRDQRVELETELGPPGLLPPADLADVLAQQIPRDAEQPRADELRRVELR